jgi:DnaJ-class molecular chaperone
MPLMSNPDKYGDMIIEFDVEYPTGLNSDQKLFIKEALINNQNTKKQHQQQNHNRKKAVKHEE